MSLIDEFEDFARKCPYGAMDLTLFGGGRIEVPPRRYLDMTTHKAYLAWIHSRERAFEEINARMQVLLSP